MRFIGVIVSFVAIVLFFVDPAFAADTATAGGWGARAAAGFGVALAAFGGALAQGKTASAALDSIGRNPGASGQLFLPMILGLVFIESLVIYALVISFLLL